MIKNRVISLLVLSALLFMAAGTAIREIRVQAAPAIEVIKVEGENSEPNNPDSNFVPPKKVGYTPDSYCSNSDIMYLHAAVFPTGESEYRISYNFNAAAGGEYNLDLVSSWPGSTYQSAYDIKINDGNYVTVTTSNTIDNGGIGGTFNANIHKMKFKSTIVLKKGINKIAFRVNQFRKADNRYDLMIDYFQFTKVGINTELSKSIADFTESSSISIVNGVMPLKDPNDFSGCTITYTTDDPKIAVVNPTSGVITPVGGGSTNIRTRSVSGTVYAETYAPITITVNNLQVDPILFENGSGSKITAYNGENSVKVKTGIKNYSSVPGQKEATVIMLLRDASGVTLKTMAQKVSISQGQSVPFIYDFTGLPSGGASVDVFVLDTLRGMVPITGVTTLP